MMGIEHERIHLETSSVLIRQLPLELLSPHPEWQICEKGGEVPENSLLPVSEGEVVMGKEKEHPLYGWDNEYGHYEADVQAFKTSKYLVSNSEYLDFVNDGGYQDEQWWTEEGWNRPADVNEVVSAFDGWHADVLTLLKLTPKGNCYKWGLFDRDPLDRWTQGRVTLLGDAAHPMLPFMAQGSAMAIEDAVVLGRSLASHGLIDTALVHYENERRERTSLIVQKSRQATNLYQRLTGDKSEQRGSDLDFLYGYDAATVSI